MELHLLSLTHILSIPCTQCQALTHVVLELSVYLSDKKPLTLLLSSGTFGNKAVEHVAKAPTPLLTAA